MDFAVDSSGFSTCRFHRWYDKKYNRMREKAGWIKAHVVCGVKTNVITSIEIGEQMAHDSPFLKPLVTATAKGFTISEVSADKAYGSTANLTTIADNGGTAFISFKSNATGKASPLWQQMYHYFMFKREEFLNHYHKRSNNRIHLQHVEAEIRRPSAEQDRYRHD